MFSATASNNMGTLRSGVVRGDLGFVLSGRLRQFSLDPTNPNYLEPGKRPRITPAPALMLADGKPFMSFGSPGEDVQVQVELQLIMNVVEFGMNPQQAVEAARFRSFAFPASGYPQAVMERRINLEARIGADAAAALNRMGHDARLEADWMDVGGGAAVIVRDPETGVMAAGADPRRSVYALGW